MDRQELLSAIAPCGIDCINCPAHENNVTPEIQNRIAAAIGRRPEQMTCKGCRSDKRAPVCPAD